MNCLYIYIENQATIYCSPKEVIRWKPFVSFVHRVWLSALSQLPILELNPLLCSPGCGLRKMFHSDSEQKTCGKQMSASLMWRKNHCSFSCPSASLCVTVAAGLIVQLCLSVCKGLCMCGFTLIRYQWKYLPLLFSSAHTFRWFHIQKILLHREVCYSPFVCNQLSH